MTRYESGKGAGGKGAACQHNARLIAAQHTTSTWNNSNWTDSANFEWIPPTHTLNPFRNWTWLDWKFVFTVLHLNFGGFRFCGFRLSVVDCRLSVEFASPRTMMPSLLFATSAAACYAVLCRVFWPQIISIAIALRITLISSPFS